MLIFKIYSYVLSFFLIRSTWQHLNFENLFILLYIVLISFFKSFLYFFPLYHSSTNLNFALLLIILLLVTLLLIIWLCSICFLCQCIFYLFYCVSFFSLISSLFSIFDSFSSILLCFCSSFRFLYFFCPFMLLSFFSFASDLLPCQASFSLSLFCHYHLLSFCLPSSLPFSLPRPSSISSCIYLFSFLPLLTSNFFPPHLFIITQS